MAEIKWIEFKREDGTVEMRREDHDELMAAGMEGVENIPAITISPEELAATNLKLLRRERDRLLAETDWSQGADVPTDLKSKYTTYRQALRDVTDTYDSYLTVVWPDKP
jgi:hypothetical protein